MKHALLLLALVACGGRTIDEEFTDVDPVTNRADSDAPVRDLKLLLTPNGFGSDRVSPGALAPDGEPDGSFQLTARGSFDALIVVTTDQRGSPCCGQQWDTLGGDESIPSNFEFSRGSQTWVIGVFSGDTNLNDHDGHVDLPIGHYVLYGSDSHFFRPGQFYRAYARMNGEWTASNVVTWK